MREIDKLRNAINELSDHGKQLLQTLNEHAAMNDALLVENGALRLANRRMVNERDAAQKEIEDVNQKLLELAMQRREIRIEHLLPGEYVRWQWAAEPTHNRGEGLSCWCQFLGRVVGYVVARPCHWRPNAEPLIVAVENIEEIVSVQSEMPRTLKDE